MARTFDRQKAAEAQEELCEREGIPMFAPSTGYCYRCGRNIYDARTVIRNGREYSVGVSVETAGAIQITGCCHCNYSFC